MPYIKQEDKDKYEPELKGLRRKLLDGGQRVGIHPPIPKGDLTYLAYSLGLSYFKNRESYTTISTAISSLYDAAEELRRRHLNPYEDEKIEENGDVE